MRIRFLRRGYSPQCVDEALHLALGKPRDERILKRPTRANEHSVMFTATYTLNWRKVGDAVKKHGHVLSSDPALPAEFKNPPLIVYRRGRNLRGKLVHANCQPQKEISQALLRTFLNGSYKCRGCSQCNNMMKVWIFLPPTYSKTVPNKWH